MTWAAPTPSAHDLFAAYVQHRLALSIGMEHIDLTVDLTFFEDWSSRERHRMDGNHDGQITRAEVESYLKERATEWSQQVRLEVAGKPVSLLPLYQPDLDLLGTDSTGPSHHQLRLFFFAPTPKTLRAGDVFRIEDGLWPEAKALTGLETKALDGCKVDSAPEKGATRTLGAAARIFEVKCLTEPAPKTERKISP